MSRLDKSPLVFSLHPYQLVGRPKSPARGDVTREIGLSGNEPFLGENILQNYFLLFTLEIFCVIISSMGIYGKNINYI